MSDIHNTQPVLPPPPPPVAPPRKKNVTAIFLGSLLTMTLIALVATLTVLATQGEDEPRKASATSEKVEDLDLDLPVGDSGSDRDSLSDSQLESIYLLTLEESGHPEFSMLSDSELVEMGQLTCELIDDGHDLMDLGMIGMEAGVGPEVVGYLTGAAITAYCPENDYLIP